MRLLTLRTSEGTTAAARQDGGTLTEIDGFADVGALLRTEGWEATARAAHGATHPLEGADLAAVVPFPGKIICVGHNYRNHIREMGREVPDYPTLFAKYAESLIGPNDDLALPQESDAVDWEAELAVIIGKTGRRISEANAGEHIAGYAVPGSSNGPRPESKPRCMPPPRPGTTKSPSAPPCPRPRCGTSSTTLRYT